MSYSLMDEMYPNFDEL
jgi:hypothetical protein